MYFPKYFQTVAFACMEQLDTQDEYPSTFYLLHPVLNLCSQYHYESYIKSMNEKKRQELLSI